MPITIELWHAMAGAFDEPDLFKTYINYLAEQFNRCQSEYTVIPTYKGRYADTVRSAIDAFRGGHPPHIFQSWEIGAATIIAGECTVKPVDVLRVAGEPWAPDSYLPALLNCYVDLTGDLLCFPFNISTPIFYYNKDAFRRAGLDPSKPPRTWPDVAAAAARLRSCGMRYGYATSRQRWVHLDNFSAWHNIEFATRSNGLDGPGARLCLNSPLHVRHIRNWATWAAEGLFTHFGPMLEAEAPFYGGECAMITTASAPYAGIVRRAKFEVGVSPLPHYDDIRGAPQNTLPAGSAFWVMAGKTQEEYRGVATFLMHASRPEVQAGRYKRIGYEPVSTAAYELVGNPATEVVLGQLAPRATRRSRGIRLGNFERIDRILNEELTRVWHGQEDARNALDRAVQRGNAALEEFEAGHTD